MTISPTQKIGFIAEQQAERYLLQHGLRLVARNFRCRYGEIDLIMQDHDSLVFTEVRLRENQEYGSGLESITRSKQNKIIRTAKYYLQQENLTNKAFCRFDVVALSTTENNDDALWIKDAFR
jgi:putative endonuclease